MEGVALSSGSYDIRAAAAVGVVCFSRSQPSLPPFAGQFLDLDRDLAEGFHPITERARRGLRSPQDLKASWGERVEAFRTCLPPMGEPRSIVLRDLMVVVALRCGYDARTRYVRGFALVCFALR